MMLGEEIVEKLKAKLDGNTDKELAKRLGVSIPSLQSLKQREELTSTQICNLILSSRKAAKEEVENSGINILVEFYPIALNLTKQEKSYQLFCIHDESGTPLLYQKGLQDELLKYKGIYIFYDSMGHAIYVGKTRKQTLWKEMNDALNRSRGNQTLKKVAHPTTNNIKYKPR